jgi:hypothetical protein
MEGYDFTRRIFGSLPEARRSLAAWLVEPQVREVVMESTKAESGSQACVVSLTCARSQPSYVRHGDGDRYDRRTNHFPLPRA